MSEDSDEAAVWEVAEEWMASAEADRRAIIACLAAEPPILTVVAFHCQQAAEKILKGYLVLAAQRFRKNHDMQELGAQVRQNFPAVSDLVRSAESWTTWSIAYRYPGREAVQSPPSPDELREALRIIERLMAALREQAPNHGQ